jgi:hypothetical protein
LCGPGKISEYSSLHENVANACVTSSEKRLLALLFNFSSEICLWFSRIFALLRKSLKRE